MQFTTRLLKSVEQRGADDVFLIGTQHLDLNDDQVKDKIERIAPKLMPAVTRDIADNGNAIAETIDDDLGNDAACEGLNLQTLGTLINIDLPWNPTRLEQHIGRIKRFGQAREKVDMLNLVNEQTVDEKVYDRLSERMRDRYNIFGSLPDTIKDGWIDNIETLVRKWTNTSTHKRKPPASICVIPPRWRLQKKSGGIEPRCCRGGISSS